MNVITTLQQGEQNLPYIFYKCTPLIKKNQDHSQVTKANSDQILSSESPLKKRKPIIIDLKLEYIQNQIYQIKTFKEFLHHINYQTKELIKAQQHKHSYNLSDTGNQKRRNSFSLNDQIFRMRLNEVSKHDQKSQQKSKESSVSSSIGQQINERENSKDKQKFQYKKMDLTRLGEIEKLVHEKKSLINLQIRRIKERMLHSSMQEDKQFYDFIELNYSIKMTQIEERLQASERNLQSKQKEKKLSPQKIAKTNQNLAVIKYGLYEADTKETASIAQYFDVRSKILNELKHINRIYSQFQSLKNNHLFELQRPKTKQKHSSSNSQSSSDNQNIHPLIASANLLKSQFLKFADLIKAYRSHSKKKQQKYKNQSSDISQLLYHKLRTLNKEILQKQLFQTKNKISKLKHQTQNIQNAIKELQAFKALTLMRNNSHKKKLNNLKKTCSLTQNNKTTFNDQILRIILEHQFFEKNKALRIQTKFSGLEKRNIRSISLAFSGEQWNNFRINKLERKCISAKSIRCRSVFKGLKEERKQQDIKINKKAGLEIVSRSGTKKENGSSAETNP